MNWKVCANCQRTFERSLFIDGQKRKCPNCGVELRPQGQGRGTQTRGQWSLVPKKKKEEVDE